MSQYYLGAWHISFTKKILIAWLYHEDPMVLHRKALNGWDALRGARLTVVATSKQAVRALGCLEWFWQNRMSCAGLCSWSHCLPFYMQPLRKSSVWQQWHECLLAGWCLLSVENSCTVKLALVPGSYLISPNKQAPHSFEPSSLYIEQVCFGRAYPAVWGSCEYSSQAETVC